jgi:hypothetical protein
VRIFTVLRGGSLVVSRQSAGIRIAVVVWDEWDERATGGFLALRRVIQKL